MSDPTSVYVSNQEEDFETPGVNQLTPVDPAYPVYIADGVIVGQQSNVSADDTPSRQQRALRHSPKDSSQASCGYLSTSAQRGAFTAAGGACVDGVTWIRQVPPPAGKDLDQATWNATGNCGPASLVMLEHYLGLGEYVVDNPGSVTGNVAPDDIQSVDAYMMEANNLCSANVSGHCFKETLLDNGDSTYDYADLGPYWGVPANYLAWVAADRDKLVAYSVRPSQTLTQTNCSTQPAGNQQDACVDQQLDTLFDQLRAGNPVIVHADYELNLNSNVPNHGHYMVLVGMDPPGSGANSYVYVVDPGRKYTNAEYADYSNAPNVASPSGPVYYTKLALLCSWSNHAFETVAVCKPGNCNTPPAILASTLESAPPAQLGSEYSVPLQAGFGKPPYQWSIVQGQGSLPPGLTLDSASGIISGTPSAVGTYQFTVQVTDANNQQVAAEGTVQVVQGSAPPTITTPALLPDAVSGQFYSQQLAVAGSTPNSTFSLLNSVLPGGLSLSPQGQITGSAAPVSEVQNASFTILWTGTGQNPPTTSKQFSLDVLPATLPPQVYSVTATPTAVNTGGASSLTCLAADPQQEPLTYAWNTTGGTFSGSGATVPWTAPSTTGTYTATCTVTNSGGSVGFRLYSIVS